MLIHIEDTCGILDARVVVLCTIRKTVKALCLRDR
jgi:hypothetical protein